MVRVRGGVWIRVRRQVFNNVNDLVRVRVRVRVRFAFCSFG